MSKTPITAEDILKKYECSGSSDVRYIESNILEAMEEYRSQSDLAKDEAHHHNADLIDRLQNTLEERDEEIKRLKGIIDNLSDAHP